MLRRRFYFLHRPRFWRRHSWNACWVSVILAAVLLACFFTAANRRIRPILTAMAVSRVSNAVTEAVNDAIAIGIMENHISYGDMVITESDANGRIAVLTSNLEEVNRLRSVLVALALEAVEEVSEEDFSIPMGNLTGFTLLSGRGPTVTVQALSTGSVTADFSHSFSEAGVNQTLHQIFLNIAVTVRLLLPGETLELPVSTEVCVAETIIVGEVPDTYLEWEQ